MAWHKPPGALDPEFTGYAIVALHVSRGTRSSGAAFGDSATRRPSGLVLVRFHEGVAQGVDDLVSGFQLEYGERGTRPVGVAFGADGALYFTSVAVTPAPRSGYVVTHPDD
jgi:glucose/arabinose dehydrogenase